MFTGYRSSPSTVSVTFMPPIAEVITSCTSATLSPYRAAWARRTRMSTKFPPTTRSENTEAVPSRPASTPSISSPTSASTWRSSPSSLIPTGVLIPVASMSIRVLIGIVQAFVRPGN